jgi:hypothetical protein
MPGQLALFQPSHRMTNYEFEFVAQIDQKALSWAFRAADLKNYYAMRVVVTEPGIMPKVAVERYAVVAGVRDGVKRTPLLQPVTRDQIYNVKLNVAGQFFTLTINGKIADVWEDDRLSTGGVGLFSLAGERSRVRDLRVSTQTDAVGKVAAYLTQNQSAARKP